MKSWYMLSYIVLAIIILWKQHTHVLIDHKCLPINRLIVIDTRVRMTYLLSVIWVHRHMIQIYFWKFPALVSATGVDISKYWDGLLHIKCWSVTYIQMCYTYYCLQGIFLLVLHLSLATGHLFKSISLILSAILLACCMISLQI